MSDEYTIRNMPHGVAVFGSIPVADFSGLVKMWSKRGLKFLHPGIADAIGASFVAVSAKSGDEWMAELAKRGDWLTSGDTGTSSKTIYKVLMGIGIREGDASIPYDPADFGRCYRLLKLHPEWVARLPEVATAYPYWGPMVREWATMTALYERDLPSGRCDELYKLMQKLCDEGNALARAAGK